MIPESLKDLYNISNFRKQGHDLIDQLADMMLNSMEDETSKVVEWIEPEDLYQKFSALTSTDPVEIFKLISTYSIKLHDPKYIGHQVSVPAPLSILAVMQAAVLNNGSSVYEMGSAATVLERLVIDRLKSYFGFDHGSGVITSGGTLANLTAMICARNVKAPGNVWNEGHHEKFAFMVSEEAHYCIDRAARVMGWGDAGVIKVPVDDQYKMKINMLQECYEAAEKKGITVLGVVGSAPTTSTGIYDDLVGIGKFCKENNLWFHIDGAHGGPAVFSDKYKHLMSGCEMADSITVDAHKMMMTPSLCTMLFFKDEKNSYRTFAQKAQYLWGDTQEEWWNFGKRTMECTKVILSTRVFILLQTKGIGIFEEYFDTCYNLGRSFAALVSDEPSLELAVQPESNIVCFRVKDEDIERMNQMNRAIRKAILEEGQFYLVQTLLNGEVYLRVSLMNPLTTMADLGGLIELVKVEKDIYLESLLTLDLNIG